MKGMHSLLFSLILLCLSGGVCAQWIYGPEDIDAQGFVKDHYTITFKPLQAGETPIVLPPNPANKVPCCLHSSGQDPAEIRQSLGLNGDVLAIFDTINAVYVRMSAQEAERWRADARVSSVEQNQLGVLTGGATVGGLTYLTDFRNNPQLYIDDRYTLNIPFVDYNGITGLYQDVRIEHSPSDESWRLAGYETAVPIPIKSITGVELIVTADRPRQVFLDIKGAFGTLCPQIGRVAVSRSAQAFNIYVFYQHGTSEPVLCLDAVQYFSKVVPLSVYGLSAGTYSYTVNGEFPGTFTLPEDNVLQ